MTTAATETPIIGSQLHYSLKAHSLLAGMIWHFLPSMVEWFLLPNHII